jgi:hypothetical protein
VAGEWVGLGGGGPTHETISVGDATGLTPYILRRHDVELRGASARPDRAEDGHRCGYGEAAGPQDSYTALLDSIAQNVRAPSYGYRQERQTRRTGR